MLTNSVEISLIASKKVGILPALMRKLATLGLIYRRCIKTDYDDGVKLTLVCIGTLECEKKVLIKALKSVPNVDSVISVVESKARPTDITENLPSGISHNTRLNPLRAKDEITHDVIHIVEDRLAETFGPVADVLLQKAVKKSQYVGELFLNLAENLDDEQKVVFLRNIEDLDKVSVGANAVS